MDIVMLCFINKLSRFLKKLSACFSTCKQVCLHSYGFQDKGSLRETNETPEMITFLPVRCSYCIRIRSIF